MKRMNMVFFAVIFALAIAYGTGFSLFSAELVALGASAGATGAVTAAPAFGWLFGVPLLPALLRKFTLNTIMAALLCAAVLALTVMPVAQSILAWFVLRLVFGGAMGLFFRCVEYWLTLTTQTATRGRDIAYYSVAFLLGVSLGASLQPLFGVALSYVVIAIGLASVAAAIWFRPLFHAPTPTRGMPIGTIARAARAVPLSMLACLAYAGIEAMTSGLLYTYAVQIGQSEGVAAMSLSACALGALIGSVPAGILSDKIGRRGALLVFGVSSAVVSLAVPLWASADVSVYLGMLMLWAALTSGIYVASLALIGDRLRGDELLFASVAFGVIYAIGALLIPVLFGAAMSAFGAAALFVCAAAMLLALALAAMIGGARETSR